jgi:hypothetical protein
VILNVADLEMLVGDLVRFVLLETKGKKETAPVIVTLGSTVLIHEKMTKRMLYNFIKTNMMILKPMLNTLFEKD